MDSPKAIVIGAGIAGLASAIRLASHGYSVSLYEKNTGPGGKLGENRINGYHFDTGPSLFTQPRLLEDLFKLAGEPIENYLQYEKTDVACQYFFANGKTLTAYTDSDLLAAEMQQTLGEPEENVKKYLASSAETYSKIGSIFLNFSLHKRSTWFHSRILKALAALKPAFLFKSLDQYNKSVFSKEESVQLFNRYATYNGSNPYKAPAMLHVIPHLEFNEGTWYPQGGMISIATALYKLALNKGVQFFFNAPVQRIIHTEGKVKGVVVNNENNMADVVISNLDVYFTYKNLLDQQNKLRKILKQERSSSAIIFYWGIKKSFKELGLHNILFSANYKKEFDCIFKNKTLQPDPTVYINITSKMEESHAPHECENWFVMINVACNTGQDWDLIKKQLRIAVIKKINAVLQTDIDSLIETETVADPRDIESNTGSFQGSLYGSSSNSKMAAFVRHPNFSADIKNLYFCGGSVHPGGGIPLCLHSARIATSLILNK